jgi:hypothetical protein
MAPSDVEGLDLSTYTGSGEFIFGGPAASSGIPTIWRTRLVVSDSVPAGTAIVRDFRTALLFDREQVGISVGTTNDDFIRNIVRVLAEHRPSARRAPSRVRPGPAVGVRGGDPGLRPGAGPGADVGTAGTSTAVRSGHDGKTPYLLGSGACRALLAIAVGAPG